MSGENRKILRPNVWGFPAHAKLSFWHRQVAVWNRASLIHHIVIIYDISYHIISCYNHIIFISYHTTMIWSRWNYLLAATSRRQWRTSLLLTSLASAIARWGFIIMAIVMMITCDDDDDYDVNNNIQVVRQKSWLHNPLVQRHCPISSRARILFKHINSF